MARTVSFTQQGEPSWLALGNRWLDRVREVGADAAATELGLQAEEIRTVQRYGRAANFVRALGSRASGGAVLAGSVAVLELATLHRLDPLRAQVIADRVLGGEIDTAQVRAEVAHARERHSSGRHRESAANARASFRNLVFERLKSDGILRQLGRLYGMSPNDSPGALDADLTVTFASPRTVMGVAVRTPRDTAAKSAATVAAELVSHLGTLLLRYDSALLVLPFESQHRAKATLQLWDSWVNHELTRSSKMYVLLLSETAHLWLRPTPQETHAEEP